MLWRLAFVSAAAMGLLADGGTGIRPRASAADYSAHETAGGMTVAATVVPRNQVHKLFTADLNGGGYLVLEVAIYPEAGHEPDIHPADFLLQVSSNSKTVRAASPRDIMSSFERKHAPPLPPEPGGVSDYTSSTIGYESGGYDPATGQRTRGVYTGTGVAVTNVPAAPPGATATYPDPYAMEQELADKALPEGKTSTPVAGYLYFEKPSGKSKSTSAELAYYGTVRQLKLRLQVK